MLKGRSGVGEPSVRLNRENLPKLFATGLVAALSICRATFSGWSRGPRTGWPRSRD
jgi:hypothetical protein